MKNLFVITNINLETVNIVASCLKERYPDGFDKIIFFKTREAEKNEYQETQIYRKYFANFEKSVVILNDDGSIPADKLYSVMNTEGEKVVDLSNGPKITTSALYFAATLCRITDIYCMILHGKPSSTMVEGTDYEYLKLEQMKGIEQLAKLSFFDLIYYTEDINRHISQDDLNHSQLLRIIYQGMISGITGFFSDSNDARSIINNLTIGNEALTASLLEFLKHNNEAIVFSKRNGINLDYKGDPIGILSKFYKAYIKTGGNTCDIICLCTVPGLLSGLRDYRNISAHYSKNSVTLTFDNARTVINMELEVIKCLHRSASLWKMI